MKKCTQCKKGKPLSEFHKDISRNGGLSNRCKRCRCKYPETVFKNCIACGDSFSVSGQSKAQKYCGLRCQKVHIRFGINEYQHEDLLITSDYKCAICGKPETCIDNRTGKAYELSIDHDHVTGKVRGVLCQCCNAGIGCFKDDIVLLAKAIEYLREAEKGAITPKFNTETIFNKYKRGKVPLN